MQTEWLKLFIPQFKQPSLRCVEDTKLYEIITNNRTYNGLIVRQDNVVIQLKSIEGKPVKILKENIKHISIL